MGWEALLPQPSQSMIPLTEMEKSSGWQRWSSLEMLKASFKASFNILNDNPDDQYVSVYKHFFLIQYFYSLIYQWISVKEKQLSWVMSLWQQHIEARKNGCQFTDNPFKLILLYGNCCIWIPISLKFNSNGAISNKPVLVLIMAWC